MEESFELALDALRQANQRVQETRNKSPRAMFAPLGEALWWIYIVDGLLEKQGGPYVQNRDTSPFGWRIHALRHARAVVTHGKQPAELSQLSEGKQFPVKYPKSFSEVVFVHADGIPPTKDPPSDRAIEAWRHTPMGGRAVRVVISETLSFLEGEAAAANQRDA